MNDPRHPVRAPAPPGPSVLVVLISFMAGAHLLRTMFSLPLAVPPGTLSLDSLVNGEWWTAFTWMFTHLNLMHLAMNLGLLILAGRAVERQAGGRHLLYIFIISSWTGAALQLMTQPETWVIGASGGVFGVIGAFSALFP